MCVLECEIWIQSLVKSIYIVHTGRWQNSDQRYQLMIRGTIGALDRGVSMSRVDFKKSNVPLSNLRNDHVTLSNFKNCHAAIS